VVFKGRDGEVRKGENREFPRGRDQQTCAPTTARRAEGVREGEGGGEGCRGCSVAWCDPGLSEGKEM